MSLGKEGEELAVRFLKKKGYRVIEKNYRTPFGEIDIIAKDKDAIVFIEVKTREGTDFGQPFEAVNIHKRQKIAKVALSYLKRFKEEPRCRFDVVSILYKGKNAEIELLKDAFEV